MLHPVWPVFNQFVPEKHWVLGGLSILSDQVVLRLILQVQWITYTLQTMKHTLSYSTTFSGSHHRDVPQLIYGSMTHVVVHCTSTGRLSFQAGMALLTA